MQREEDEIHLLDYWRILAKRRHVAITFFTVIVGIVTVYSFMVTPMYQATALILLDSDKTPTMTFTEGGTIITRDTTELFNTQLQILKSRAFADRVVKKMQLDKYPYFVKKKEKTTRGLLPSVYTMVMDTVSGLFPAKMPPPEIKFPYLKIESELDPDLTELVLNSMTVDAGRKSNILRINYISESPVIAASMANGIANAYIEHNLDIRVRPYRDEAEWLSSKMVELRVRMEESEKELQRYKEGKGIVSFESKENVITQKLQELVSQMVQSEGRRQEAEVKYNQIKGAIDNPELLSTAPDVMNSMVIQGLRTEELGIKKQISEFSGKYGPKHPQMIKAKTELETVQRNLILEARKMLNSAKTEYEIARNREASLRKAIEEQKQEVLSLSNKAIEFNVVAGESRSNKEFYELLLKKMQEASLSSGLTISNIQIVDSAVVPDHPIKPKRGLNIFLSIIIGLSGGVGMAFFVEYMDDTIKTGDDVDNILGLPFLGFVPIAKNGGPLYVSSDSGSLISESYRTIRTSLMLSSAERPPQVILVTGSTPNEGKTTTAANIGIAMAQTGEKVLLIDADIRRHNLHQLFNLDNTVGISNIIAGNDYPDTAIKSLTEIPNLDIITGGVLTPNPSELLGSNRMKDLIAEFRGRYDRIILDSPPVMAVSDPLILSRLADGVVLVVWGGVTSRNIIMKANQSLVGVNARLLGVVLNKVVVTKNNSYQYYYPYYQSYGSAGNGKRA